MPFPRARWARFDSDTVNGGQIGNLRAISVSVGVKRTHPRLILGFGSKFVYCIRVVQLRESEINQAPTGTGSRRSASVLALYSVQKAVDTLQPFVQS
jgi:hypothetical protein